MSKLRFNCSGRGCSIGRGYTFQKEGVISTKRGIFREERGILFRKRGNSMMRGYTFQDEGGSEKYTPSS